MHDQVGLVTAPTGDALHKPFDDSPLLHLTARRPCVLKTGSGDPLVMDNGGVGDDVSTHVRLSAEQVVALRRELPMALDQLDALEHLCSVQGIANRLQDAISAAL